MREIKQGKISRPTRPIIHVVLCVGDVWREVIANPPCVHHVHLIVKCINRCTSGVEILTFLSIIQKVSFSNTPRSK